MINRCLLTTATGIIMSISLLAQSEIPGTFRLSESLVESIQGETSDFESILQDLEDLQKNPLDLNTADREQLERLPFLTDFQITSLLDYRMEKGKLISIYELQVVFGFTRSLIEQLLPFVTINSPIDNRSLEVFKVPGKPREEAVFRFQRVLEKSNGYLSDETTGQNRAYPGSPWFINCRYLIEADDRFFSGITVEKDPGESLFTKSNKNGFDFVSAHFMVKNTGIIKSAVIGDYRLAFGQGLTLWNGAAPGKSSMPVNIVKRQDGVKAFNSNDENDFFRGLAATFNKKNISASLFFSSKKRDANLTDTADADHIWFSSFQGSGYHRTRSEIIDEKSVRETVVGANFNYRNHFMKIGSTLVAYMLDKYMEAGDEPKDVHDFSGRNLVNFGIDYTAHVKNLRFFGETSKGNGYWATVNGMLLNVNKYAAFSVLYRSFGPGYYGIHTAAFSEGSVDSNEEGFYVGSVLHPLPRLTVSAYADLYRFPWLKNGQSAPAIGSDYLLQADFNAGKGLNMYVRLKIENNPEDIKSDTLNIEALDEIQNTGIRFHIGYKINNSITMQNRLEYSNSQPSDDKNSRGIMIYHDIEYRMKKMPVRCDLRLSWFHTDDFSSRIYAYEQDMTAGFSFSPLYGKGLRSYLMLTAYISRNISASLRLSNSWFSGRSTIGSGNDEINSAMRNDVKVRVVVHL